MPTIYPIHRVLPLDGANGTVMCRMHLQETSRSAPRKSSGSRMESATRSLLRMKNLAAVRGGVGHSMVGPADYYANLEHPHQTHYTIQIEHGIPQFNKTTAHSTTDAQFNIKPLDNAMMTQVPVRWISGRDKKSIKEKQAYYASSCPVFGESLFPNPGILEIISESDCVTLPSFDPRHVDLLPFKARLVANNAPFQITPEPLPKSDEYRAVSFHYEQGYASNQVKHGGGLFLETHDFSQTMTPLDANSKGFVTLGKWNTSQDALDLIAIQIPYGYTLIIDKDCIHGDATLHGMFMMCMTSNHVTMQSANSVFLKHPSTKNNIRLNVLSPINENLSDYHAPRPYVLYQKHTQQDLKKLMTKMNKWDLIFNPFSVGFWKVCLTNIKNSTTHQILGVGFFALGVTALALSISLTLTILALAAILAVGVVASVAGCGFFAAGTASKIQANMRHNELPIHMCMA